MGDINDTPKHTNGGIIYVSMLFVCLEDINDTCNIQIQDIYVLYFYTFMSQTYKWSIIYVL